MHTVGSKMKLFKGYEAEYKRRHDELWPELSALLKDTGIKEYYIYLDEETLTLFAFLKADDLEKLDSISSHPVMKKWWTYMKDIMETNPDESPVNIPLKEVFNLKF
ncbi:MAG: L-rhamnose mutarotase [Chitinophagaceae bacterium]|nr:L-rhamnose mutarotase [Chitinophagaceae bacterium]